MGHCLWTGIVDEEKAPHVARALLSDAMFTGWGVRTLSNEHGRLQPDLVPLRRRVAARQRDLRRGTDALRLRRGGAPGDARARRRVPWFGDLLPELFSGIERETLELPGELPDVVLAAGVGRGVAAAVPPDAAAVRARHPQRASCTSRRRFPTGSARCGSTTSRSWAVSSRSRSTGEVVRALQVPEGLTIVSDPRSPTR